MIFITMGNVVKTLNKKHLHFGEFMNTNNIIAKVKEKIYKQANDTDFVTKGVKIDNFHEAVEKKYLETLKKEWNLKKIDIEELDWDLKDIELKWYVTFPRSSGVLNIQISVPDQSINVSGDVTYTDENDKDHDFSFSDSFDLKNAKTEYKDLKVQGTDIAPQELDWSSKEVNF